jgi:hypothetical protein
MATFETQYSLVGPWAEMWQNPDADATVLTAMLLSKYGEQALDWDPMTIRLEIQDDFRVAPADEVMNKICAMQLVMSSSDFFERIDTFINVCNTLSEGDPFFEVFTPLESEEIAYAIATVALNRDMLPFNPTIKRYVKEALKADGFSEDDFPPIFAPVFGKNPSSKDVRHTVAQIMLEPTASEENKKNISDMLTKNLGILLRQFNGLPGLEKVDDHIMSDGLLLALGESSGTQETPSNEP